MGSMYPDIDDLVAISDYYSQLPAALIESLKQRYAKGSAGYTSNRVHYDGRMINACMTKDSVQDATEEIVDAIFNLLVIVFKASHAGTMLPGHIQTAFDKLIEVWQLVASD